MLMGTMMTSFSEALSVMEATGLSVSEVLEVSYQHRTNYFRTSNILRLKTGNRSRGDCLSDVQVEGDEDGKKRICDKFPSKACTERHAFRPFIGRTMWFEPPNHFSCERRVSESD